MKVAEGDVVHLTELPGGGYRITPHDPDLVAAYTAGIVQNHPFVGGNKRTGLLAGAAYLDLISQGPASRTLT